MFHFFSILQKYNFRVIRTVCANPNLTYETTQTDTTNLYSYKNTFNKMLSWLYNIYSMLLYTI